MTTNQINMYSLIRLKLKLKIHIVKHCFNHILFKLASMLLICYVGKKTVKYLIIICKLKDKVFKKTKSY